jgi:WD40 repeat protein
MKKVAFLIVLFFVLLSNFTVFAQIPPSKTPIIEISSNTAGTLLAVSDEKNVTIYDTSDFSQVCVFNEPKATKTAFFTENGEEYISIMTSDGHLSVRKIRRKVTSWYYNSSEPYFSAEFTSPAGLKNVACSAISDNSDYVAVAFSDNSIKLYFRLRITRNAIAKTISSHDSPIYGLEFNSSGEYLASVSDDGKAYIWDTNTCARVSSLDNVFTQSKVPVYFTSNSSYIISQNNHNSFLISDFSGKALFSITISQAITSIRPLKNPDLIAIGNERKEVVVYSISARKAVSVYEVKRNSLLSAFEFNSKADSIFAGYRDGSVLIIDSRFGIKDYAVKVTESPVSVPDANAGSDKKGKKKVSDDKGDVSQFDSSQSDNGDNPPSHNDKGDTPVSIPAIPPSYIKPTSSLYFGCGYTIIPTDFFLGEFDFDIGFQKSFNKLPLFAALDIKVGAAVPKKNFPYNYYTQDGETKKAPWFYSANPALIFGFESYNQKSLRLFLGLTGGATYRTIWNNSIKENVNSPLHYGYFGGITAGLDLKGFTVKISCLYDSMFGLQNSCSLGATIKFYSKKSKSGGKSVK